jgi:hypothetical protein
VLLQQALHILEEHYRPGHFDVARGLLNLVNAYRNIGDPRKQKVLLEQALASTEKH